MKVANAVRQILFASRLLAFLVVVGTSTAPRANDNLDPSLVLLNNIQDWDVRTEESRWWKSEDQVIVGGSLDEKVPYNTFIATKDKYDNFELKLKIRIEGSEGFVNSGVQIRSVRVEGSSEMEGYQVDAGEGWWGKLYDESRRNKVIGEAKDLDAVNKSINSQGWNEFRIVAEGPRIRSWINEVPALDYIESDPKISLEGKVGLQVHGDGKTRVSFKDISIRRLADSAKDTK